MTFRGFWTRSSTLFVELAAKYDTANQIEKEFALRSLTPAELWAKAQASTNTRLRLYNYNEIVDRYPQSEHASKALFMVGFVNAEELKNYRDAERAFLKVLRDYPDSEVAISAKWMMDNLNQPMPEFQSIEDLNKQIEDQSQSGSG